MRDRERLEAEKMDAEGGEELLLEALLIRAVTRRAETRRASKQEKEIQSEIFASNEDHEMEEVVSFIDPNKFFLPSNREEAQDMLDECRKQISLLEEKKAEAENIAERKVRMEKYIKDLDIRKQGLMLEIADKEDRVAQQIKSLQEIVETLKNATASLVILEEQEIKIKENLKKLESNQM